MLFKSIHRRASPSPSDSRRAVIDSRGDGQSNDDAAGPPAQERVLWGRKAVSGQGASQGPWARGAVPRCEHPSGRLLGRPRRCQGTRGAVRPSPSLSATSEPGHVPEAQFPARHRRVPQLSALPPQQGRAQQPARVAASQLRGLSLARRKSTSPMLRLCLLGWRWLCEENAHNVSKLFNNKKREASTHRHHHWKPALHQQLKIIRQWKQGIGTAT